MGVQSFQDLIAWQKGMKQVYEVYQLVKKLPVEERFALADQMRRAVVSIPSNIAEGQSRNSLKEFINFLYIAKESNSEIFTQLLICRQLNYIEKEELDPVLTLNQEIGRILTALIKSLKQNS